MYLKFFFLIQILKTKILKENIYFILLFKLFVICVQSNFHWNSLL